MTDPLSFIGVCHAPSTDSVSSFLQFFTFAYFHFHSLFFDAFFEYFVTSFSLFFYQKVSSDSLKNESECEKVQVQEIKMAKRCCGFHLKVRSYLFFDSWIPMRFQSCAMLMSILGLIKASIVLTMMAFPTTSFLAPKFFAAFVNDYVPGISGKEVETKGIPLFFRLCFSRKGNQRHVWWRSDSEGTS